MAAILGKYGALRALRIVRTILEAIISFFPVESSGAVGSITCSSALRKQFAKEVGDDENMQRRVEISAVQNVDPSWT